MDFDSELIDKFIRGTCTDEEIRILQKYFKQDRIDDLELHLQAEWDELNNMLEQSESELKNEILQSIQESLSQNIPLKIHFPQSIRIILRAAAVVLLLCIIGYFIINISTKSNTDYDLITVENAGNEPKQLSLVDGSQVWLKPGSNLSYASPFQSGVRSVSLEGEAYFEVAHNPSSPFVVQTGNMLTRVLGTRFHVSARGDQEQVEVALLQGSVALQLKEDTLIRTLDTLKPGEAFTFRKIDQNYTTNALQDTLRYAWKDGIIRFQRADIEEVVRILEEWYGIHIQIIDKKQIHETLVHRIDTRKMTFDQVIEGIHLVARYRFEKKSKNYYIVTPN